MIARYVNVVCDVCFTPATDPQDTSQQARRLVPLDWARTRTPGGGRVDLCPACIARDAHDDGEAD